MQRCDHVTSLRAGIAPGYNALLERASDPEVGLDFGVVSLAAGETWDGGAPAGVERAALVVSGRGTLSVEGAGELPFARASFVEESPAAVHLPCGARLSVRAASACEIAVLGAENAASFPARLFRPEEVEVEHRGKGMLDDAAYRLVRCVFDRRTAPAAARLVLGEVVTLPGRWSSYPPHHHDQPEIYYYRFAPEHGYGHGEVGDDVYYLRDRDLLRITRGRDHGQVAAPGYHMYYLWAIRHLDDRPYTGFEYAKEHADLVASKTSKNGGAS